MKKLFLPLLALVFACGSAWAQNPTVTLEKFADKPIHGIIVAGAFDVQLSQADGIKPVGAKVEIEPELADKLDFEYTDDGYVRLTFKNDVSKYITRSKKKPQAWVTVTDLRYLNVTGASHVVATSVCSTTEDLRILSSGTATIDLLEASAHTINMEVSGSSKLDDITLRSEERTLLMQSGTSKIEGELKAATAHLYVSGVSGLTLTGGAEEAVLNVTGTSSMDLTGFTIGTVTAKAAGLGKIRANILGGGTAEVGGTASFRYTGAGLVTGKGVKRLD